MMGMNSARATGIEGATAKRWKMSQCKIALREMSNEEFEELVAARQNAANVKLSEGASEAV